MVAAGAATAAVAAETEQQSLLIAEAPAPAAGTERRPPRRWSHWRLAAAGGGGVLVLAAAAVAAALGAKSAGAGSQFSANFGALAKLFRGPWGEYAGPDPAPGDFLLGAKPKFVDPGARFGSPPKPKGLDEIPTNPNCPKGCEHGTCCNHGKLCCAGGSICCGTSCCTGGSICCNAAIGLCCAPHTMCCWGKLCCSPSWTCGNIRRFGGGRKFDLPEACGGGGQFRRLLDKHRYRQELMKMNRTITQQLLLEAEQAEEQQEKAGEEKRDLPEELEQLLARDEHMQD